MDSSLPLVSVIIPVYNDNEPLKICLAALVKQTYPQDRYEIIVVDNGSQEDVKAAIREFDTVKLTYESQPGAYVARNRGIEIAQGEIVAFTDADCIPEPTWIEHGVRVLKSEPNVGLVAGHIEMFVKNPGRPNAIELYETIALSFPQDQFVANDQFGVTANLFTFKHVIDAVGLFDGTLKCYGDVNWGKRVYAAGYRQLYAKDAQVNHPAQDTWENLRKRSVRTIGGKYDVLVAANKSRLALLTDFFLFLKPPFSFFWRTWQDPRLNDLGQKLQFTAVMLRLRWVAIQERFRLQFIGGVSDRG
jgi:glycosyltransferase involved in cell wall biosynthesis